MKKSNFLLKKKVVILLSEDGNDQPVEKVVKIVDTITTNNETTFVYFDGKVPGTFLFSQIKELYQATPAAEKIFEKMSSAYSTSKTKLGKLKSMRFNMKKVNWNFGFKRPNVSFAK